VFKDVLAFLFIPNTLNNDLPVMPNESFSDCLYRIEKLQLGTRNETPALLNSDCSNVNFQSVFFVLEAKVI